MRKYTLIDKIMIFCLVVIGGFAACFMQSVGMLLIIIAGYYGRYVFRVRLHSFLALAIIVGRIGQILTGWGMDCACDPDQWFCFIGSLTFPSLMWLLGSFVWTIFHNSN